MTATDELRRLLDERGVEWNEGLNNEYRVETFFTDANGHTALFVDFGDRNPFGGESELSADVTPEKAIEATLGRGTCKWEPADFITEGEWWNTSCGESFTWEPDGTPNYCPNCGRKVRV